MCLRTICITCAGNLQCRKPDAANPRQVHAVLNAIILFPFFCGHDKLSFDPNGVHLATNKIIYVFSDWQFEMTILIEALNRICFVEAGFKYCFCFQFAVIP